MEHSEKIAVVNRYVEAFEKSDMAIIREIFAEDAVVEDPVGTEPHVGIAAIEKFYEVGLSSGARLRLTGEIRCSGNCAAFPFDVVLPGVSISPIDVFTFNEDGKVIDMKAYWSL